MVELFSYLFAHDTTPWWLFQFRLLLTFVVESNRWVSKLVLKFEDGKKGMWWVWWPRNLFTKWKNACHVQKGKQRAISVKRKHVIRESFPMIGCSVIVPKRFGQSFLLTMFNTCCLTHKNSLANKCKVLSALPQERMQSSLTTWACASIFYQLSFLSHKKSIFTDYPKFFNYLSLCFDFLSIIFKS